MKYNIKKLRETQGLTQDKLGKLVHLPQSRICEIEKGRAGISLEVGVKMASVLGVSPEALLKEKKVS